MRNRLGEFDIPEQLAPYLPLWASQIGFAAACLGAEALIRAGLSLVAPGSAPFALVYPGALVATLFAGWFSGTVTLIASIVLAWYFILPVQGSFALTDPADIPRMGVITVAGLLMIAIAEYARRGARQAVAERNAKLEQRDLLFRELDHRVKNNFSVVASLLDLQRRRTEDPATREALTQALLRVDSIAQAHRHLYRAADDIATVDMAVYLTELCRTLAEALFLGGAIHIEHRCESMAMERDRAVSIGLVVNELVTNAVKHAFPGRDQGKIEVVFERAGTGWRLVVRDDGCGLPEGARASAGLGRRLVEAFARQAGGTLTVESSASGATYRLEGA